MMTPRSYLPGRLPALSLLLVLGAGRAFADPPVLATEIYDAPAMVRAADEIVISVRIRNISKVPLRVLFGRGPFGDHADYMLRVDRPGGRALDSNFPHGRDEPKLLPPGAVREDRFSIYDRLPDLPPGSYSISVAPILLAGEDPIATGWSAPVGITVK
jgi:hypothetical protein